MNTITVTEAKMTQLELFKDKERARELLLCIADWMLAGPADYCMPGPEDVLDDGEECPDVGAIAMAELTMVCADLGCSVHSAGASEYLEAAARIRPYALWSQNV